jgi:hypothetical protein
VKEFKHILKNILIIIPIITLGYGIIHFNDQKNLQSNLYWMQQINIKHMQPHFYYVVNVDKEINWHQWEICSDLPGKFFEDTIECINIPDSFVPYNQFISPLDY